MDKNKTVTNRNVDIVFCIDATGSMAPCLEAVKNNALRLHEAFVGEMVKRNSNIENVRIKVIVFRDYAEDGAQAMVESNFYELPADETEFADFMAGITACGGGDAPENGLEALYLAMTSHFTNGPKDRQVIVLFTDADALPLKDPSRMKNPAYPSDMVDEDGLVSTWACVTQKSGLTLNDKLKRMVIFAPTGTKYEEIRNKMERCVFEPTSMADGLGEINFDTIIDVLAASASSI